MGFADIGVGANDDAVLHSRNGNCLTALPGRTIGTVLYGDAKCVQSITNDVGRGKVALGALPDAGRE